MTNNCFKNGLQAYSMTDSLDAAKDFANTFLFSTIRQDYRKLTNEELIAFVRSGLNLLEEEKRINLLPGEALPIEARVDFILTPTYVTTAVAIHLMLRLPGALEETDITKLKRMMEYTFSFPIAGHGYDADAYTACIMLVLCQAGAREFLEQYPDFSPAFAWNIRRTVNLINDEGTFDAHLCGNTYPNIGGGIMAAWAGCPHPVFVYGTLMRGEGAHHYLHDAVYAGDFYIKDYAIYHLGSFPGIVAQDGEYVRGELYYVNAATLATMDTYEGEGSLYLRTAVTVHNDVGTIEADAYVYRRSVTGFPIPTGKWKADKDDYVWYACYGSNLSSERFKTYILGTVNEANGIRECGCTNKNLWTGSKVLTFPGELYFARSSGKWDHMGVAFYDPSGNSSVTMMLYKITMEQCEEIQRQEGLVWYGKRVSLGVTEGLPIYTFSEFQRSPKNLPCNAYATLIENALISECGMSKSSAKAYMKKAMKS